MVTANVVRILDLQDLDLKIARLKKSKLENKFAQVLGESQEQYSADENQLLTLEHELAQLNQQSSEKDKELKSLESKKSAAEARLYDGSVNTAKENTSVQNEIKYLQEKISETEDVQLQLFDQIEGLEDSLAAAKQKVSDDRGLISEQEKELDEFNKSVDEQILLADRERQSLITDCDDVLLKLYEAERDNFDGTPLARFEAGKCLGCNMQLSAISIDRVKKSDDNDYVRCDECNRVLVK